MRGWKRVGWLAALLPVPILAWVAVREREGRLALDRVWRKAVVVPLNLEGQVSLPAEPAWPVLHAFLVERSDPERRILLGPEQLERIRWRIPGLNPHRSIFGEVIEAAHGGKPVVLEYDVTAETRPLVERGALVVRFIGLHDESPVYVALAGQLAEAMAWSGAVGWTSIWALGVWWTGRRPPAMAQSPS